MNLFHSLSQFVTNFAGIRQRVSPGEDRNLDVGCAFTHGHASGHLILNGALDDSCNAGKSNEEQKPGLRTYYT